MPLLISWQQHRTPPTAPVEALSHCQFSGSERFPGRPCKNPLFFLFPPSQRLLSSGWLCQQSARVHSVKLVAGAEQQSSGQFHIRNCAQLSTNCVTHAAPAFAFLSRSNGSVRPFGCPMWMDVTSLSLLTSARTVRIFGQVLSHR